MTTRRPSAFAHAAALVRLALGGAAFASATTGCGSSASSPHAEGEPDRAAACANANEPLHPLIVEWPATRKVTLDGVSRKGVVIVALSGCDLTVVTGCHAAGGYEANDSKPDHQHIEMKDEHDLFAFMPIAPPKIGATLRSGKSLVLDYTIAGARSFSGTSVKPEGDCTGATHYVKRIELGAYTLDTKASAEAGVNADLGGLGAGGLHQESDQRHKGSGDPARCESDPKSAGCDAPVRLELAPL